MNGPTYLYDMISFPTNCTINLDTRNKLVILMDQVYYKLFNFNKFSKNKRRKNLRRIIIFRDVLASALVFLSMALTMNVASSMSRTVDEKENKFEVHKPGIALN